MNRLIIVALAAFASAASFAEIERGLGNEEIVDCNGGDGWIAYTARPYPDGSGFYITIRDTTKVKVVHDPIEVERTRKGWVGTGDNFKEVGSFEWRGHNVKEVSVVVPRSRCEVFAWKKIHALIKSKSNCALTILCDEKRPWNARLVGAEFPDVGKTFAECEDGKIKEVKQTDK